MFQRIILFVCFIFPSSFALAQDYTAKITLTDETVIEGKLLKISEKSVVLDPDGNVAYRLLKAERIKNIHIVELDKTIDYPLTIKDIPIELKNEDYTTNDYTTTALQKKELPQFLGLFSYGYSSVGGDFYEGFNSGSILHLGARYLFYDSNPTSGRFFIGFSYNYLPISGETENYDDYDINIELKLAITEYSFEFGRTTKLFDGNTYLYLLFGGVFVTNEISVEANSISASTEVNSIGLRMDGGVSIGVGTNISIHLIAGYDIILEKKEKNIYNYSEPNVSAAGGIFHMSIGASYGL